MSFVHCPFAEKEAGDERRHLSGLIEGNTCSLQILHASRKFSQVEVTFFKKTPFLMCLLHYRTNRATDKQMQRSVILGNFQMFLHLCSSLSYVKSPQRIFLVREH